MRPTRRPRFHRCLALLLPWLAACQPTPPATEHVATDIADTPGSVLAAVRLRAQGVEVEGRGVVQRMLPDDTAGSPHQRFLLRLDDGATVLVAHNIAVAPRLDGLAAGDTVAFRGEYIWNPKGGTLHWTHRDPHGTHAGGWLRWRGRTYR